MNLETQAAFARRIGKNRAHVTRLKQSGRLVMQGKRVVVDESLALLEATESPLPRDVAKREALAAERAERTTADQPLADIGRKKHEAQYRKLKAEADKAEMERDRLAGSLVEVDGVIAAANDMAAVVRNGLEILPDRHAPEVFGAADVTQARALLREAVELVAEDMARELEGLADRFKQP
jgi:hypothetical protein